MNLNTMLTHSVRRARTCLAALSALAAMTLSTGASAAIDPPPAEYPAAHRVVAVSNITADPDAFLPILQHAGLIDEHERWIGRDAHLVILGNFAGSGDRILDTIGLIRSLNTQAEAAGGGVHALVGVYEFNVARGNFDVIPAANYQSLVTDTSGERRQAYIDQTVDHIMETLQPQPSAIPYQLRKWRKLLTLRMHEGGPEFLDLFAPGAELGDWLRSRNSVIKIGDALYSRGGLGSQYGDMSLEEINDAVRSLYATETAFPTYFKVDLNLPPFWGALPVRPELEMREGFLRSLAQRDVHMQVTGVNNSLDAPTRWGFGGRAIYTDSGIIAKRIGSAIKTYDYVDVVDGRYFLVLGDMRIAVPPPTPLTIPMTPK